MSFEVPVEMLDEARVLYRRMARLPRLNFASRGQVILLRSIMRLVALVSRPLRPLGLRATALRVSHRGREVSVRVLEPEGRPKGIVVDIHGGAWTIMRATNDDALTGPMARDGFVVVSVDYRLAPEHPFADVIGDCAAALAWALIDGARHYQVDRVFLHGDSVGAHLCMMAALACRPEPGFRLLGGMVLFFGAFDLSGTPSVRSASENTLALYGPTLGGLRHDHRPIRSAGASKSRRVSSLRGSAWNAAVALAGRIGRPVAGRQHHDGRGADPAGSGIRTPRRAGRATCVQSTAARVGGVRERTCAALDVGPDLTGDRACRPGPVVRGA